MSRKRTNPDFLNGVPELVVLKLLSHRPMYGYEVVQALKRISPEALAFGEGCIYPVLHKLETEGSVTARRGACKRSRSGRLSAVAAWQRETCQNDSTLEYGCGISQRHLARRQTCPINGLLAHWHTN